jgi:hypothetical protein
MLLRVPLIVLPNRVFGNVKRKKHRGSSQQGHVSTPQLDEARHDRDA